MPRLPVRPLAGALVSALMIVTTSLLGTAPAERRAGRRHSRGRRSSSTPTSPSLIAKCEGCVITLLSYDGANPVYSSVARDRDGWLGRRSPCRRPAPPA